MISLAQVLFVPCHSIPLPNLRDTSAGRLPLTTNSLQADFANTTGIAVMPVAAANPLRGQAMSVRKDKAPPRRLSHQPPILASWPSDPKSIVAEPRSRMSSRSSADTRASLTRRSPSLASTMASTNGSPSPDYFDGAPRTKTGRISTAKKGKPVHRCDVEDCGKVRELSSRDGASSVV